MNVCVYIYTYLLYGCMYVCMFVLVVWYVLGVLNDLGLDCLCLGRVGLSGCGVWYVGLQFGVWCVGFTQSNNRKHQHPCNPTLSNTMGIQISQHMLTLTIQTQPNACHWEFCSHTSNNPNRSNIITLVSQAFKCSDNMSIPPTSN